MADCIENRIELRAPVSRVWRALTDYREFGEWFRVKLEGPFQPGRVSRGRITYPGYEHVVWEATVEAMEPERLFSFRWHPSIRITIIQANRPLWWSSGWSPTAKARWCISSKPGLSRSRSAAVSKRSA